MVTKIICDYCGKEISEYQTGSRITTLEINGNETKDVCIDCSKKIVEFLDTIKK